MSKLTVAVFFEFFYGPLLYLLSHREKFWIAPLKPNRKKSCPPKNRHRPPPPLYINYEPSLKRVLFDGPILPLAENIFLFLVSNLQLVLYLYPPGHLRNSLVKSLILCFLKISQSM